MAFREVGGRYDGPRLEGRVLEFWREQQVFRRTLEQTEGRPVYTFYEGPPTANGRPGIHHVLARTFKDIYPRYKTMRGYHVPRKAGWDTHGLPVEHEIEKELGIFDKSRIDREVGVEAFTRRCRESVLRYIGAWEQMTERMGFWVDLQDAYYTLDNRYIESVWFLLRQIWDKGLMYQDHKVVPYDPRIGATLSSHEVALGYREVEDPSVYVRFPCADAPGTALLVWTTTPWTLPSNLALAVHPGLDYAEVELDGERLILAEGRLAAALGGRPHRILRRLKGTELVGRRYTRLFEYLPVEGDVCRVLPAEFVSLADGTGIVHVAPAYGADDLELGRQHGLPVLHGVGLDGNFLPEVAPVAGRFFKEADPILTRLLKERGLLFREERILHNYPFGWRTGDPLIYYAKNAWYIRTTAVRERLIALNKTINWVPETIRDGRFGNWLEHNVDWALSRERFWGTPLPVWTDGEGHYHCIGSLAELEALAGQSLGELDLHRPAIDAITFRHPETGREFRRVPEVIDCWFDSGAMPYAQWHHPFEQRDRFERHFPADYICEAIDQTRGWFYTLHAIATLVSDSVAFRNVICLSHIVDKDGRKMSKSQGNIVDPYEVFDAVGADPLRWYFTARVAPDIQKRISVEIIADVAGTFLNTFWNTYAFFVMYANLDRVDLGRPVPPERRSEMDRWALALLQATIVRATDALDRYDAKAAGEAIEAFVEQLSNWYVRRNRRRFWRAGSGEDKQAAYLTLYECLLGAHRLMAPFMPFLAEEVHQNLVRGAEPSAPLSVHLMAWPEAKPALMDAALIAQMATVQRVVGLGRAARESSRLRVRQPLARMLVRVPDDRAAAAVEAHREQILDELNVKALEFIARDAVLVSYRLKPNLPRLGKRFGKRIPAIRAALEAADGAAIAAAAARGEGFILSLDGEALPFEPADVLIETHSAEGFASAEEGGTLVALDTRLTTALVREGLARELVRTVQDARKQAGLDVADRIRLRIGGTPAVVAALEAHRDLILGETLCTELVTGLATDDFAPTFTADRSLEGDRWTIELARVEQPLRAGA
ncbi:MAG: isoleucine--tRNA ligase [Candidatus Lambdaproteobacteria bacterium]|nr:isoleucine--tRNA ligase [Candidatus Lambdaproteobacteria bacterium]